MKLASQPRKLLLTVAVAALALLSFACTSANSAVTPPASTTAPEAAQASATADVLPVSNTATAPVQTGGDLPQAASTPAAVVVTAAPAATASEIVAAQEEVLTALYDRVVPSVVHIFSRQGQLGGGEGSGFVWDNRGHIVTNYHVVEGASALTVLFADGSEYAGRVIGSDPDADLAVIKIDAPASRLRPVEVGNSSGLRPGQMTIAVGNPFGQDFTMTTGIVSAIGRVIESGFSNYKIPAVVQTDAAINPGNSGGPLFDRLGRVIGINTQIRSDSRQSSGVGFAVPVDLASRVVPSLIQNGTYEYAYLGISGGDVDASVREAGSLPDDLRGALLRDVIAGGPASSAGLLQDSGSRSRTGLLQVPDNDGDIVTAIDGRPVRSMDDLIALLALYTSPGETVKMTVYRDGKLVTLDVTMGSRPRQ